MQNPRPHNRVPREVGGPSVTPHTYGQLKMTSPPDLSHFRLEFPDDPEADCRLVYAVQEPSGSPGPCEWVIWSRGGRRRFKTIAQNSLYGQRSMIVDVPQWIRDEVGVAAQYDDISVCDTLARIERELDEQRPGARDGGGDC